MIGSLPGAAKNQADLAAKIKAAEDERAAKQAEKQKAQDAMTAGLVKKGKLKDAGKDASAEDKAVKAAEDKAANLLSEIDDLELKLVDLKDKKAVADKYLAGLKAKEQALRKQLADCEKKCAEKGKGTKVGLGNNGKPVEKSPFVSTDCEPCQVIVSQLNDVIGSLPGAAKNQADLAAKIKAAEDERAAKQAEKQKAQDAMTAGLVKKGKLKDAGKDASAEDKAVKAAEDKAANLLSEIDDLELKLVDLKDKKAVADKYLAGLKAKEQALRKQLADCEKKCAEKGKGTKVGLGNNGKPVEKSPFVSTDCEPCQVIVSQLNDVIGSLPGAAKNQADLAAKIKAAEDERAAKQAEKQKAQDAMTAGLVKKGKLKDAGKDASAEDKAVKAAEDKAANLLSEIDDLELKLVDLKDKKAVADKYLAGLKAKEQALRKQLADCEKKCAEKGKGTKVGLGNNGKPVEKSPFVSTDCEPCQVIVSQLNDVIGSLPGAAKNQADLAAKIKAAEDERAAKQAEKQKAQDAMTAGLVKKGKLKDAGKDASAEDKAVKAAEDKAANLLSEIDDLELKLVDLKDKKAVADKYLAGLKAKEQALRKQLADCEKKCAEKGKGTKVGMRGGTIDQNGGSQTVATMPVFAYAKTQPKSCRAGQACTFVVSATNTSANTYDGPVFFSESGRVATGSNGAAFGGAWCSPARGGESLCLISGTSIAPDKTVGITLQVKLPRDARNGTKNCVSPVAATSDRVLAQMVQVALAAHGYKVGTSDGAPGRKTLAALAAFAKHQGVTLDSNDMTAAYKALLGTSPVTTDTGSRGACVVMKITQPKARTSTHSTTRETKTPKRSHRRRVEPNRPAPRQQIDIGPIIQFGIGVGSEYLHRRNRDREPRQEDYRGRD